MHALYFLKQQQDNLFKGLLKNQKDYTAQINKKEAPVKEPILDQLIKESDNLKATLSYEEIINNGLLFLQIFPQILQKYLK